jgi:acetyltransferase-like isoleucine patch superfamily enzyme
VIGNRVRVFTWTDFNVDPDGLLEIGDDSLLVGAVFMCAHHIRIGARVTISYHVTLADSDFHPKEPHLRLEDALANAPGSDRSRRPAVECRPVVIDDDVWVGIGATVLKGVHIGRGARILAGSVVTRSVAPGATVEGNPARARENL